MIKKFSFFKNGKKSRIDDIIDDNVKKSNDFGLKIDKSDIKLEKEVLNEIFSRKVIKSIHEYTDSEYHDLFLEILYEVQSKLEYQMKYYFIKMPARRFAYKCHIEAVISDILRFKSNDR